METLFLHVVNKVFQTEDCVSIHLQPIDNQKVEYKSGQFLTFIFQNLERAELRRSYSLSSAPEIDKNLIITVKKIPNGRVSNFLFQKVKKGDVLEALAPAGDFILPENEMARDIFLIGGGSGMTPLFSIMKTTLSKNHSSIIHLINANSNQDAILFQKELNQLLIKYPTRFQADYFLSRPEEIPIFPKLNNLSVHTGYLNNFLIEKLVRQKTQFKPEDSLFYLCGPQGLMLKANMTLGYMGFSSNQIYKEVFEVTDTFFRPPAERFPDSTVQLQIGEQTKILEVKAGQTILEGAEKAGIKLPYSCRSGICTTCKGNCLEGKVIMYGQETVLDSEMGNGLVLTCVGYPLTERVTVKIG